MSPRPLPLPALTPVIHVRADQLRIGDLIRGGQVVSVQSGRDDQYVPVGIKSRRSQARLDDTHVTEDQSPHPGRLFQPEYA